VIITSLTLVQIYGTKVFQNVNAVLKFKNKKSQSFLTGFLTLKTKKLNYEKTKILK